MLRYTPHSGDKALNSGYLGPQKTDLGVCIIFSIIFILTFLFKNFSLKRWHGTLYVTRSIYSIFQLWLLVHITLDWLIDLSIIWFFGIESHVALDINTGPVYNALLLRLIPGDLLSACPHRQFHTLPGLLDSRAALSNSYRNACAPSREAVSTYHFMMNFGMTRSGREPETFRMRGGHPDI